MKSAKKKTDGPSEARDEPVIQAVGPARPTEFAKTRKDSPSIDEMDAKILDILQRDGRASFVHMADMFGTSEGTIRRRVQNLMDRGFIRNFSALLDYQRFGTDIWVHISLVTKKDKIGEMGGRLASMKEACSVHRVMGDYNLVTEMVFSNMTDFQRFIDGLQEDQDIDRFTHLIATSAYKPCPWSGL